MTPSVESDPNISVRPRRRLVRLTALGVTVGVVAAAAVGSTGASAAAKPNAQAVGRFVDGSVGGMPIQKLADVKDARAKAAPNTDARNPLTATLLGQLTVPLGNALQLPGGGVFTLGAANQIAVARTNGYSYGASGAVANTGGVDLTDNQNAYPSNATVDLSSAALGSVTIPGLPKIPGLPTVPGSSAPAVPGTSAAALGGIRATTGAVSSLAQTKAGGAFRAPQYNIAGLKLSIASPALGGLLTQLAKGGAALTPLLAPIVAAGGGTLPAGCTLTPGTVPSTLTLDKGAVVLDTASGSITVDLAILLQQLGLNINNLPPNTDLLAYLLNNLGKILSSGLANVISGITQPLQDAGTKCLAGLPTALQTALGKVLGQLTSGQKALVAAVTKISDQLSSAGAPGLAGLTSNLAKAVAIGVNVQQGAFPLASAATPTYKFSSKLAATPNQATSVVAGQGVVRAIEIDIAGAQVAALALATSAAGPSAAKAAPPTPTPSPTTSVPNTMIPTGVPAGAAGHTGGGSPALPIVVVLLGLVLAGGGVTAYRVRGKFSH